MHIPGTLNRAQVRINLIFIPPSFHLIVDRTVNCPSQETEVTSTPTRPVENVVITTKGLQDRNNLLLDGRTVEKR